MCAELRCAATAAVNGYPGHLFGLVSQPATTSQAATPATRLTKKVARARAMELGVVQRISEEDHTYLLR